MPAKLITTVNKIQTVPNQANSAIIREFHHYMEGTDSSMHHKNNNLKVIIAFANFLGSEMTFYEIKKKEQVLAFLNTKIRDPIKDPERRWITTWNHYLNRIRLFFRWFYNCRDKEFDHKNINQSEYETPEFVRIKPKKTSRPSPYSETEIWERDEILFIIKYEQYVRNKAALTLFWDLDARNHEVTLLKIKHIRLKERYGEGEIPHEAKTGTGPILLTCSFPYVRDWLNEHPFKNEPDARLICNLMTGSPVNPEAMWTMMKQLRNRIVHMLEIGAITNEDEKQKLEYLLKTKKWNPYCIRHSAITSDSDFLPEYALKKKVRWSMNSKQGSRYIKRRMGNDLKNEILAHNGIVPDISLEKKPSVLACSRCNHVNGIDYQYCSICSYPLVPSAFEQLKEEENSKIKSLELKHEQDVKALREEMDQNFKEIMSMIRENDRLRYVKPDVLSAKAKQRRRPTV